ncbi:MAG TPA: hypothetical protein VKD91_05915 [Pyrinomonadaceae bacterium]|nr:hypothetical protein [Pyrinomonadaceae bacterium]
MESIVGLFNSLADARRAAAIVQSLGIPEKHITVLSPQTPASEIEAEIPTTETEQPGMGPAVGGAVGAALGTAGGLGAGTAVATVLMPGVGPVLAFGLIGAAVFGAGGAAAGVLVGNALEKGIADGVPRDEMFVYEDALRRGRSIVIAFADDAQIAESARAALARAGAESVDAAREEWWIGLRDAESEHYAKQGGDFNVDEARYRLGFESALHPDCRGQSCEDAAAGLKERHGDDAEVEAFRQGYVRGQRYLDHVAELGQAKATESRQATKAA